MPIASANVRGTQRAKQEGAGDGVQHLEEAIVYMEPNQAALRLDDGDLSRVGRPACVQETFK